MSSADPINAQIITWLREWSVGAKEHADKPENHLRLNESPERLADHCRLPIRLDDWDSDVVYWYFIIDGNDGKKWRVLRVHSQQWVHAATADQAAQEAGVYRDRFATPEAKAAWLGYYVDTGLIAMFYPFHEAVGFKIGTTEPRLVVGKRENLASYKFAVDFYMMVPYETTAGVAGGKDGGGANPLASGSLVDARGNPVNSGVKNRADNKAFTDRTAARTDATMNRSTAKVAASSADGSGYVDMPAKASGQVIPMNRKARRAAARKKKR